MFNACLSVLIVACGCGLPLSIPFTFGSVLRTFARHQLFLRDASVVESLSQIDAIIFDKTGTLTHAHARPVTYEGPPLSHDETLWIKELTHQSPHPLSRQIYDYLNAEGTTAIDDFEEFLNCGIQGRVGHHLLRLGSQRWIQGPIDTRSVSAANSDRQASRVYVEIDGRSRGYFEIRSAYRPALSDTVRKLGDVYALSMLSGDHEGERAHLARIFPPRTELRFNQLPLDKLNFIKDLQQNHRVLMIGDGLNDAGALAQSDAGVAIAEDTTLFTPGSDAILVASQLIKLPDLLALARRARVIVYSAFMLTFLYNAVAIGFAASGNLTPVIAAILMPLSAISVVVWTLTATRLAAQQLKL
jgi:Cu+-exporting ATPase